MYCSSRLQPPRTLLPTGLRGWLGARLCPPAPAAPDQTAARTCLFALGQLGDFVLALSALRLCVEAHGAAQCTLVVTPAAARLAEIEFPEVPQLVVPGDAPSLLRDIVPLWRRERRRFAARRHDSLVCFSHQRSLYYELASSWIHAGRDVRLQPETYPAEPADGLCTELLAHGRLVAAALDREVRREEILPRFHHLQPAEGDRLLIFPFSRDPSRSLPADTLRVALQTWRARSGAPAVFGGSPEDHSALVRLAAGVPGARIETPLGLDALLHQIAAAGAVLSADSAPAHIAAALDKRSVVMTSRAFHGYAQPWGRSARQQVFVHGTPADQIAAALPVL